MKIGQDEGVDPYSSGAQDWWTQNAPAPAPGPADAYQGFASTWDPGGTAPTNAPVGAIWDPNLAMFVADTNYVAPAPAPAPTSGGGGTTTTTDGGGGVIVPQGVPTSGFGSAPAPYVSDPNVPVYNPLPAYVPPTWTGGDYQNPTVEDLYASPGYQARLDERLKAGARRYAAQGTILNGGTLKALDRSAQDYATNEYQTLRNNTYDAYVQKYKQFTDAAGMDLNARTVNANDNQGTFANRVNTYLTGNARTLSDYLTNLTAKRNSEIDYWSRLQDLNQTGAGLAGGSR